MILSIIIVYIENSIRVDFRSFMYKLLLYTYYYFKYENNNKSLHSKNDFKWSNRNRFIYSAG